MNIKKKDKIEFINDTNNKFLEARNHGHNGGSWWYPKANVMAYNVKLSSFMDIEEFRKLLTKRQKEYYTDEMLASEHYQMIEDQWTYLIDELKDLGAVDIHSAGRMGGWCEVEYQNDLIEVDENTDKKDLSYYYVIAVKLFKLEQECAKYIKEQHEALNKFIGTKDHYEDLLSRMYDDETIGQIYKDKAEVLLRKLK